MLQPSLHHSLSPLHIQMGLFRFNDRFTLTLGLLAIFQNSVLCSKFMKSFLSICLVHFSLGSPVNADCNRLRRQAICHKDPGSMFPVGIRLEKNFENLSFKWIRSEAKSLTLTCFTRATAELDFSFDG